MATIKLLTKSTEKQRLATIYLRFVDGRKTDVIIPTPEKVYPEFWDNENQRFKQRILFDDVFTEKNKADILDRFSALRSFILGEHFILEGRPASKEWLKTILDKFYNMKAPGSENLNQYFQRFIDEAKTGTRLTKDMERFSPHTIKGLVGFQSQLNEYQGVYTDKALKKLQKKNQVPRKIKLIDFEDITIDFYNDLVKFFYGKNYGPNTVGKHVKSLKTIMKAAREEGLHRNSETERKSFKSISEPSQAIYLTEKELKRIYELDLASLPDYDKARDIFLVGCYTAQRFSDYSKIIPENIREMENGKKVIELIQQKTGEKVVIPVRFELDTILQKYNHCLPKTYEQKVNELIKHIAEEAKITETISLERNKGGVRIKSKVRKCDLVVTHTARRTGCTLMYLAGIPTIDIMKISGHKSEREFLKYIRVTKEETAMNLSNHPYFIGNVLSIAK